MNWYWLNTVYACGGVATNSNGIVVRAAPIYRRFMGRLLSDVVKELKFKSQFWAMMYVFTESG